MNEVCKPARHRTVARETASTLIEVLIASVTMSSAVIELVAGRRTLFESSIRGGQLGGEELVAAVDQIGACSSTSYTVAYLPPPANLPNAAPGSVSASCYDTAVPRPCSSARPRRFQAASRPPKIPENFGDRITGAVIGIGP